ncbi:MAG: beta-ketoacyl-ACP synthase II [Anaerolineae bacterium]|nr:beta-ketoacyl-ACP synthase II [Anaerolineae bacterium]
MNRVVVTGYGMITPLGLTTQATWEALLAGQSGVGPIMLFDASNFSAKVAAEVKNFDPAAMLGPKAARRMARFEQLANIATQEALAHAELEIDDENSHRVGLLVGCALGGISSIIDGVIAVNAHGPRGIEPLGLTKFITTSPSLSINYKIKGPSFSVASACASGADALGVALLLLRAGMVDAMLAGGADEGVASLTIGGFERMGAYSLLADNTPAPFSATRDGIVIGEGAAVLVLERLEHAQRRGASILAELGGYGVTSDAYHLVAPPEDGAGAAAAIQAAMTDANITADQIDYINAHGTATLLNDSTETAAIKAALGEQAYHIPISSTKSMTGHMMGATGAAEAIFCIEAIRNGIIPPTINLHQPDPTCDLDYVPDRAREMNVHVAMSNSFGFGGHNAVLILRKFEE